MSKNKEIQQRNLLRAQAEDLVKNLSKTDKTILTDVLMHELLVHKVELEMQNEELRRIQHHIEEARDLYKDLYEFAPMAYITLSLGGTINAINLTGAILLGLDRSKLINRRFSSFVSDPDKDRWYRVFIHKMKHPVDDPQKLFLKMKRPDQSLFNALISCAIKRTANAPLMLSVALTEFSSE